MTERRMTPLPTPQPQPTRLPTPTRLPSRRTVLTIGAAAAVGALAGCAPASRADLDATPTPAERPRPAATLPPEPVDLSPVPPNARVPAPNGTIDSLPGAGSLLAWTIDDGASAEVIAAYAAFAASSGTRLTMFVTGTYTAWDENVTTLAPLIASGQVQLANHTWSHADLTSLDDAGVADELQRCHDFVAEAFGVDARPFFRPPFGFHDDRVDAIAADLGYTVPTMWHGTLSDSGEIPAELIVDFAREWFLPQHIVIGHLNFMPVTTVFDELHAIIAERGLATVTLNDVFSSEYH
ncbi:polysaccharide deacetylase family protein [Agromyces laixinhei]|uniref:polysaccharide deacetylase family protein n=1 Tax=Agromyces laixinhei TaxID=2585717 RepID=UPI0018DB4107|nr:polysaccharide deacetylase family protein [Agromyces laixinhei]